ncbi:MAG: porin [Burkholderiales bacterium]|jgi:predicted porin|uniref:porin n=1 Tax=Limnobacter sp. TaxID=2003368 RepID=UPI00395D7C2C|nr:porin [Burkholderiales bacterium]
MNKKLVAAALGLAFAAPVFADSSNVTLYGRVHQAIEHNTTDVNGANSSGNGTNIADYSSRLGVRGVEDLGGGLSAIFAYEFGVDTDAVNTGATNMNTRHAYLGLKGSYGTFVIGSQDGGNDSQAPLYNQASAYMFNVNNNAGQLTVVNGNDAVINRVQRVGNSLGYANTIAGVKVSARHALGGTDAASGAVPSTENDRRESSIAADYTIGALTFGGGYTRIEGSEAVENTPVTGFNALNSLKSQIQFGAKYNFGAFQLAGLIGQNKYYGTRNSDNEIAISGLLPLSANSGVQALYAQAENGRATTTAGVQGGNQETDNTQAQISYYYDFSKRTRTYVGFNRTNRDAFVAATGANIEADDDSFVVGLRHNF